MNKEDRVSGNYYQSDSYDERDERRQDNSGGGLRKQLEEALAELKQLRDAQKASVPDLLKDKGIDPALAEIVPEGIDPKVWIDKYAHLLGAKTPVEKLEGEPKEAEQPKIQAPEHEDPALAKEREAVEAMRGAQKDGSPSVVSSDLLERMGAIDNEAELLRFFGENGAPGSQ